MKNTLRDARAVTGITQGELAALCDVSRQTINAVEGGKYVPSTVLALKMAKALKKPVEELFQLEKGE